MITTRRGSIEASIEAAALAKYGSAQVSILRTDIRARANDWDEGGVWYWLSIDGELLGRRRSKAELLQLIEREPLK